MDLSRNLLFFTTMKRNTNWSLLSLFSLLYQILPTDYSSFGEFGKWFSATVLISSRIISFSQTRRRKEWNKIFSFQLSSCFVSEKEKLKPNPRIHSRFSHSRRHAQSSRGFCFATTELLSTQNIDKTKLSSTYADLRKLM